MLEEILLISKFLRQLFKSIQSDLAEKIYYLSSFREPPRRFYGYSYASDSLDPQGKNFPQVLWQYQNEPVYFVDLDHEEPCKIPLIDAVTLILNEILDLEQSIRVQSVGERQDILQIMVERLGESTTKDTLADVGLGYNQILPVIIQGLLTPPGGLVIFEQPEIHLHPDVQAKLVRYFVRLAKSGRRVLVETHSSHMIDSLCLAIARDREYGLEEKSSVLFVHAPNEADRNAWIKPVEINRYGEIINWPPNFMPDTLSLQRELLRESIAKQKYDEAREQK